MDSRSVRNTVLRRLIGAPSVVLPFMAGITALLAGWAASSATTAFIGASAILASAAVLASRWILRTDGLTQQAMDEQLEQRARHKEATLDQLEERLEEDDDPRTEAILRRLRDMRESYHAQVQADGVAKGQVGEISDRADTLFRFCVTSLERSLELWHAARTMNTREARRDLLNRRAGLLEEIEASVRHLARIFDGVRTLGFSDNQTEAMSRIRRELDASLDVARRVEERLTTLELETEREKE